MNLLSDIETPATVVDLDRMTRNLDRAAVYATAHGLALRPHVKTHKSVEIAAEQLRRGAAGVTCATPREAEVMSEVTDDILIAYPPVGKMRAERIARLAQTARITVALDSLDAVLAIERAAAQYETSVGVYIELDLGMHRVGVSAVEAAIGLAKRINESRTLSYRGIAFYPGHIREPVAEQKGALVDLSQRLSAAVDTLAAADVAPTVISGGSTPTLWETHLIAGVTEFRPGTYVFNDRTTAEIGACTWDDCALTVLATVVSTAVPGQAVVDAGSKALGREPIRGAQAEGFGALLDRPDIRVKAMSEEHGLLDLTKSSWRPRVGELVRIVPNHVCIVVHLNDRVFGVRNDLVETSWPIDARGREREPTDAREMRNRTSR